MHARLVESFEIAPEVRHFVFEALELDTLRFTPGQFVSLSGRVRDKVVTRAYSIASPPDGNRFELCLNRVREGLFSPLLFDMQPGATVEMKGPLGYFTPREPFADSVFVATGTGIAPIRSMLAHLLPRQPERRLTLLYGVRYPGSVLYREEFERMAAERSNFRFWRTVTRPNPLWLGRTGRVQKHLLEAIGPRRDLDVYICGLKEMVDDVRAMLKGAGFDRKRLIYEKYD